MPGVERRLNSSADAQLVQRLAAYVAVLPAWPALVALLAVALALPSLVAGRTLDDEVQWVMSQHVGPDLGLHRAAHDLFAFVPAGTASAGPAFDAGIPGWWSAPGLQLTFYRPLASLSVAADHAVFGRGSVPAHLHTLAVFVLFVLAAFAALRTIEPDRRVVGLALLVLAVDDAHGLALGWLANRNAIESVLFGLLALVAHVRWRRDGWAPGAPLSAAAFALALLFGEMGVTVWAYTVAWALTLDRGPWRQRLTSLLPSVATLVAWRISLSHAGYGTHESALYIDPIADPLRFAGAVVERLPILLAAQLTPLSADPWMVAPLGAQRVWWVVAVGALLAIGVWLARHVARTPVLRFAALGAVGATIPVCATLPSDRLLWGTGLGGALLVAHVLIEARPLRWPSRAAVAALAATHLLLAPVLLPVRTLTPAVFGAMTRLGRDSAATAAGDAPLIVVLRAPDLFTGGFVPVWRAAAGLPQLGTWRVAGVTIDAMVVRRTGPLRLELENPAAFLDMPMDGLLRSAEHPYRVGERHDLGPIAVEILALGSTGHPTVLAVDFASTRDLDRAMLLAFGEDGYVRVPVPPPGTQVELPAVDVSALLGTLAGRELRSAN